VNGIRRDVFLERAWTMDAAIGVIDAKPFIEECERRARSLAGAYVSDPMTIRPGLDRVREIVEELMDARNHAVFLRQERELSMEEDADCRAGERALLIAYECFRRLEDL
jgi:hypothetical protein